VQPVSWKIWRRRPRRSPPIRGLWRAERPEWYTAVCIVWFCIMGATIVGITVLALANIEVTEPADPVL